MFIKTAYTTRKTYTFKTIFNCSFLDNINLCTFATQNNLRDEKSGKIIDC